MRFSFLILLAAMLIGCSGGERDPYGDSPPPERTVGQSARDKGE